MKHVMGLAFAGLLGIVAAGLNWVWLSSLATPEEYVAVSVDLQPGDELTEDDLVAVPVPGDRVQLRASLVPWRNRAILFGATASRTFLEGDIVFQRDVQAVEETPQWEVIGPFRLISVGERFKEDKEDAFDYTRTDGNNLTIAVDANFDERTRRLLEMIQPQRNGSTERPEIVAVQVLPNQDTSPSRFSEETQEVVYQTVSLDGIENVPGVLLAGNRIRFVVPSRRNY